MKSTVELRKFPYPYNAMLAICSDLDETPDHRVYIEILRFLNTTDPGPMGEGVGLEIGNTMYFDMPPDQLSYWNTDDAGRAMIRALMASGHIDCIHSFGDLATRRDQVVRALEELERHDIHLKVWVDHGIAATNFGADIMRGRGDLPGSESFHADLTIDYGVEYVWLGRVTSLVGQSVPRSYQGILSPGYRMAGLQTLGKEVAKGLLGRFGYAKYAMNASNELARPVRLRSGHEVVEFMRSNSHGGGIGLGETADGMSGVLTEVALETLVATSGYSIIYTHLGKSSGPGGLFGSSTISAFRRLARIAREHGLMVTTTRRLLDFWRTMRNLNYRISHESGEPCIMVEIPPGSGDGQGITFYVERAEQVRVEINGRECERLQCNPADHTGRESVGIPWSRLEFPAGLV